MTEEEKDIVNQRIMQEGFDYTFYHYSNWNEIKDRQFHKLRKKYLESKNKLCDFLGNEEEKCYLK